MYVVYVKIHRKNIKNRHGQDKYQLEDSLEMEERKGDGGGLVWKGLKKIWTKYDKTLLLNLGGW